ncbi:MULTISPECIES: TetR/AcrR family transcriptional regulator [Paenibacillus]|uniref:TetR/AcrR family transcriptional regulator n=1 Tax=Paenibacillus albilobatus TaxID=2716884 RepID=A0A919XG19_9BACL|nr:MULTISPECIES: TetR/AcrR family transcriptional regulator [Paenibacillus]GIO32147.1 TetR/AcrR family transcriptional regulator [Paenibacillus albilobatus]
MRKQPEITEKTKQSFISVFCELYCQKPIEKITVQEIANKSGYNRSTFYQYFSDVYDLLRFVENDILDFIREKLINTEQVDTKPRDLLLLFEEKGAYLNALLGDYGNIRFIEKLKGEFFSDEQKYCFPKDSLVTPYLLEFHLSTSFSLLRLWQRRQKDLPPDELIGLIDKLFTSGISSVVKNS